MGKNSNLLIVAALLTIGGCRSTTPAPSPAAVAPLPCATRPLAFRPRPGVAYGARTDQQHHNGIYQTRLSFTPEGSGWSAIETDFSLNRPTPVKYFGDLRGAELHWRLDGSGAPLGPPERKGSAKPGYLENMTFYAFAPAGLGAPATCVGTEWSARWQESDRIRSFRYRIESTDGERVRIRVDGLVKTVANDWRIEGTFEVSIEDGLTGAGDLRVAGPGAPAVNDYPRRVSIAPAVAAAIDRDAGTAD